MGCVLRARALTERNKAASELGNLDTEADTCRKEVVPKLIEAGWDQPPYAINEQRSFTDGRIVFVGGKARRGRQKRADFILRYRPDFAIAVVEAKSKYKHAAEGLQQAKEYAEILRLKFAYATNGSEIIEADYTTGTERTLASFPSPDELWRRLSMSEGIAETVKEQLLTPTFPDKSKPLRYYQEISVNRTVQAVLQERNRILLTLCTGAGKTAVAFQICWKLWNSSWNPKGKSRKPKILFLADRNVLVDDPKDKDFSAFGDARFKITGGEISKGRDIYFAIYQAIAGGENREGLFKEYAKDFFDLIIIDECHRGRARTGNAECAGAPQRGFGERPSRLRLPGDSGRGRHWLRSSGQLSGHRQSFPGYFDNVSTSHDGG